MLLMVHTPQADAEKVLGSKGLAISVTPPSCGLPAWGRAVLQVSMFNDMCGDYFDMLHVKVRRVGVGNWARRCSLFPVAAGAAAR